MTADVIASCQYAVTVRAWIRVLEMLLAERDDRMLREKSAQGKQLLKRIRTAVREQYVTADGRVRGEMQGSYVMVLYAGIVNGDLKSKVAAHLAQLIRENGDRLDTGFVSTPHLLDVLWDNGYRSLACRLLYSEGSPSWLYMVRQGATAIWEQWNAILPDGTVTPSSMNHYSLGSVGDWLYRKLGGIIAAKPGYREVLFAPEFDCGLDWCECEKRTPFGVVSCRWKRKGSQVCVQVDTPVEAKLILPERVERLRPGSYEFVVPFSGT